jgi:hypothetical protein
MARQLWAACLLGVLFCLVPQLAAQQIPGSVGSRRAERTAEGKPLRGTERLDLFWGVGTQSRNRDDDAGAFQRARAELTFPIYPSKSVNIFGAPTLDYLRLQTNRDTMPRRVGEIALGLFAFVPLQQAGSFTQVGAFVRVGQRSDFDRPQLEDTKFIAAAFARAKVSDAWSVQFGLSYLGGTSDEVAFFRYTPIPSFEATFKPDTSFELKLGIPETSISWKPSQWFDFKARYFVPLSVDASISHHPIPELTITEYFGRTREDYDLTGKRWPEEAKFAYEGWAAGLMIEGVPIAYLALRGYAQLNFATRWKVYRDREENTLEYLKLQPGLMFGLRVEIRF